MGVIERALGKARGTEAAVAAMNARRRITRRATDALAVDKREYTRISVHPDAVDPHAVVMTAPAEPAVRAYKVARTRLLKRMAANNWRSVAVTSAAPGDGKSLTALNLSLALAQESSTHVFLVDLDLQRPSLAGYLGLHRTKGLSDYLAGDARIEQVIYDVAGTRLSVLPNFESLHDSSELLRSPRMDELVAYLGAEQPSRIVVFDMPPTLVGDDVLAFADSTDCVMLVVSEGSTSRVALENARSVVAEMNLVGVVLNRATQSKDDAYAYY